MKTLRDFWPDQLPPQPQERQKSGLQPWGAEEVGRMVVANQAYQEGLAAIHGPATAGLPDLDARIADPNGTREVKTPSARDQFSK